MKYLHPFIAHRDEAIQQGYFIVKLKMNDNTTKEAKQYLLYHGCKIKKL